MKDINSNPPFSTKHETQDTRYKAQFFFSPTRHKVQGTKDKAQNTRHKIQGTNSLLLHKAQKTRHKVLEGTKYEAKPYFSSTRHKVQGTRHKVRGTIYEARGTRGQGTKDKRTRTIRRQERRWV